MKHLISNLSSWPAILIGAVVVPALAILALLAAGCARPSSVASAASAAVEGPPGASHILQIDFAGCRPPVGASSPSYDGDFWHFTGSGSLRCPVAVEAGDYVFGWSVFGRSNEPEPGLTSACLQRLETVMTPEADRHFNIGSCAIATDQAPGGAFVVRQILDAPWWSTSEDDVLSLWIMSSGTGDSVGAATVFVARP